MESYQMGSRDHLRFARAPWRIDVLQSRCIITPSVRSMLTTYPRLLCLHRSSDDPRSSPTSFIRRRLTPITSLQAPPVLYLSSTPAALIDIPRNDRHHLQPLFRCSPRPPEGHARARCTDFQERLCRTAHGIRTVDGLGRRDPRARRQSRLCSHLTPPCLHRHRESAPGVLRPC